ncbi:MAG: 2-amino-3,7-dideoxy-D-threo-hept-6-ulosonate synthase [Deltaproteobacteria bacterium]|jgi:class I fructose-bisphosphate aldolase|nr:2-amino-3,7-dideoxy-D-threo-hept-6-ulosonate synthase [Deltaproteobacteria bacterium]
MQTGKLIRLERIFNRNTHKSIIIPMDHGVSVGPLEGLEKMNHAVNEVAEGGANAVLGHKGLIRCGHRKSGKDVGLIMHLSSSTNLSPMPNRKTLTATVEDALRAGADGVSIHVNLGDENEAEMLADFGQVAHDAEIWGMPLLAMIYGRGPKISDSLSPEIVAHCARVGAELGADVVKVPYTGDIDSFSFVVESCCIPVLIAGGPKTETTREFLLTVEDAMKAGAAGISVGRNVFQHPEPRKLLAVLDCIVHGNLGVDAALAKFGDVK